MLIRISLALFVVHCIRGQDAPVQCEKISECSCEMNNGMGTIDISSLASPDPDNPRFTTDDGTYTYNSCRLFNTGDCIVANSVAVCQSDNGGLSCGTQSNMTFKYDSDSELVTIAYYGGDGNRISLVELHCSNTTNFEFSTEEPRLTYQFKLYDESCCFVSKRTNSAISAGSVLVIIFFCALVAYFAAGLLFLKLKSGATGKDMIPNRGFWFGLPGMIKDGILFVFTCGRTQKAYAPLE